MQSIPVEPRGRNVPLSDCLSVYVSVCNSFVLHVCCLCCLFVMFLSGCPSLSVCQSVCQSPYRIASAAVASVGVACPLLAACNCQLERLICLRMQLLWGPWSVNGRKAKWERERDRAKHIWLTMLHAIKTCWAQRQTTCQLIKSSSSCSTC